MAMEDDVPGRSAGPDGLLVLRTLFGSFVSAIVLIGVVVLILTSDEGFGGDLAGVPAAAITAVVGILLQVVGGVVERPLTCTDAVGLAASYRNRFFLRLAFAESAALVGFVLVVLSGNPAVYLVGAAVTAYGFARLAPTGDHLERDQEVLRDGGCGLSLEAALRG